MVPVLILTLAAVSAGVPSRGVEIAPQRDTSGVDWAAVQARTREVDAARVRHHALQRSVAEGSRALELRLEAAAVRVGEGPTGLARWLPPGAPSAQRREDLRAAMEEVENVGAALAWNRMRAQRYLQVFEARLGDSSQEAELRERIRREQQLLDGRTEEVSRLAGEASTALRTLDDTSLSARLMGFSLNVRGEDPATLLAALRSKLQQWSGPRDTVLGAELTYVQGGGSAAPLATGQVTPAYLAGGSVLPTMEDTTQDREVELSAEVSAKAQELGTARAAYEFVRNQTRLEWYHGALKGSTQTLRDLRGNDADLSTLLVALLRAQGTPARYVRGTVEVSLAQLAAAMALLSSAEADAFDAALAGGPAFTLPTAMGERVLSILTAGAIPFTPVKESGAVVGVRMERVWVEAYVPYAEYRGVGEGSGARQWVPLEPALTARARSAVTPSAVDVLAGWSETPASLTAAYLRDGTMTQSPLDFFKARVTAYLGASHPGVSFEEVLRTAQGRPEALPLLPGSLPYRVVAVHEEVPFLPESLQQRVRLTARDETGELLRVELPLYRLTGHRSVLGYKPATPVDEVAVSLAGGLYAAPASIVQVLPVLRVDGREVGVATRGVRLGSEHGWTLEVLLPGGSVRRIDNRIIAGNFVALGVGGPGNGYKPTDAAEGGDLDGDGVRFLYERAAAYASAWTAGEEQLARLVQVVPVRPTANFVFVQNQLHVDSLLGLPHRLEWRGLEVDADFRAMTPVELVPGRGQALARLSGYEGSYLGAHVLTAGTGEAAVASTSVLQAARAQTIEILELTPENQAQQLPRLAASNEVLRDVTDLLALGRHILIPASPVTVEDWTGTGFIAHDPRTEEGGYFLSGRISGGQTVVRVSEWTEQDLVTALKEPSLPKVETDPSRVAGLVKVLAGDLQRVQAGKVAPLPLRVIAVTSKGQRVKGAQVTFSRRGGAKPGFSERLDTLESLLVGTGDEVAQRIHSLPGSLTVATRENGEALVYVVPDPSFSQSAIFSPASPERQLWGVSDVMATVPVTGGTMQLQDPFRIIVLPEAPAKLTPRSTALSPTMRGLELGYPLGIRVLDKFGNMLANQSVTWRTSDGAGRYIDAQSPLVASDLRVRMLDAGDPAQVAELVQHTPTDGEVRAEFIPGTAGAQTLTAQVGGVTHTWPLAVVEPAPAGGEAYAFRLVTRRGALFHGIFETPLNSPVVGMVMRWASGSWTVLTGKESGLASVKVRLTVEDVDGKELLRDERSPFELSALPGDDDQRVVFRPDYLLEEGGQFMTFTAEVKKAGSETPVCCASDSFFINPVSAKVRMNVARVSATGAETEMAGVPALVSETEYVKLTVRHPSDFPVYLRVVQQASGGSGDIVEVPGPDVLARHPQDPSLIRVPANLTVQVKPDGTFDFSAFPFAFPVKEGTLGGTVAFEIWAPDWTQPGPLLPAGPIATKRVSILREPRLHLVGADGLPMNLKDDDATYVIGLQPPVLEPGDSYRSFHVEMLPKPTDHEDRVAEIQSVQPSGVVDGFVRVTLRAPDYRSEPLTVIQGTEYWLPNQPTSNPEEGPVGVASVAVGEGPRGARHVWPEPSTNWMLVSVPGNTLRVGQVATPQADGGTPVDAGTPTSPSALLKVVAALGHSINDLTKVQVDPVGEPGRVVNPTSLCITSGPVTDADHAVVALTEGLIEDRALAPRTRWRLTSKTTAPGVTLSPIAGKPGRTKVSPPTGPGLIFVENYLPDVASDASVASLVIRPAQWRVLDVGVYTYIRQFSDFEGPLASITQAEVDRDLVYVNRVWRQACIKVQQLGYVMPVADLDLIESEYGDADTHIMPILSKHARTPPGTPHPYIEVYYRYRFPNNNSEGSPVLGVTIAKSGFVVTSRQNEKPALPEIQRAKVFAHELGHAIWLNRFLRGPDWATNIPLPVRPKYGGEKPGHSDASNSLMYFDELSGGLDVSSDELLRIERADVHFTY
ncbi:transglutaminase domain-containing protein [Myxococcaceae bacterium GXIMD 01537]